MQKDEVKEILRTHKPPLEEEQIDYMAATFVEASSEKARMLAGELVDKNVRERLWALIDKEATGR